MKLPDEMHPVLVRALIIAVDDRTRHLAAAERDDSDAGRQEARDIRAELEQLREVQILLMQMVLR